jgi:glucose/mannose-6-phosphate isomerase
MTLDKSNMLKAIEDFPKQCRDAMSLSNGISVSGKISKIIVAGMGGSAVGGDILKHYMHDSKIPVITIRDYVLPNYVDENTLVFAVSYSGNTEETLSAFEDATRKGAKIIAVTSGGKLASLSKKVIKIPSGLQPRAAVGYLFFPVLGVLANMGLVKQDKAEKDAKEMLDLLSNTKEFNDKGMQMAKSIGNKIPIMYASEQFAVCAYRWKTQFNENSKTPAFCHTFSELNHNEIVGYQTMPKDMFHTLFIRDENDNPRIKKRMEITKEILSTKGTVEEVYTKGKGMLVKIFSVLYYADFASYYLALQKKIDPSPVVVIENLKKKLTE